MHVRYLHSVPLVLDSWHLAGTVLRIQGTNRIVDAATLREDPDAKILTDEPEAVCRVLGISFPDVQVVEK